MQKPAAVQAVASQALQSLASIDTCAILGAAPQGIRLSTDITRSLTTCRNITRETMGTADAIGSSRLGRRCTGKAASRSTA